MKGYVLVYKKLSAAQGELDQTVNLTKLDDTVERCLSHKRDECPTNRYQYLVFVLTQMA